MLCQGSDAAEGRGIGRSVHRVQGGGRQELLPLYTADVFPTQKSLLLRDSVRAA